MNDPVLFLGFKAISSNNSFPHFQHRLCRLQVRPSFNQPILHSFRLTMYEQLALAALSFGTGVVAQQAGTLTAETHPSMPWQLCTDSGCTEQDGSVTLDANWRWVHDAGSSTNCYTVSLPVRKHSRKESY